MASAAAAKRQSGLTSGESKAIKRSASGGGASAVAPPSVAMKVTSTSTEDAPKAASLSEKRRVAALISWEKRRKSSGKVKKAAKPKPKKAVTVAKRKPTVEAIAVPVTPPKGKKTAMQNDSQPAAAAGAPAAKRPEFGAGPAERAKAARMMKQAKDQENEPTANTDPTASRKAPAYSGEERRQAAKLGWEKRRNPKAKPATATTIRSQAAKLGWERRRKEKEKAAAAAERAAATGVELKDPSEIRRQAAKLGWERRRKPSALESGGSTSDASSADEAPLSISAQKKAAAATAAEKKVYSAAQRRQAAIAGWERRRNSTGSSPYDMVPSVAKAKAPPHIAPPKPSQPKKDATNVKPYRQGTKRSRRLASESDTNTMSHDTETRRINELVTHLRLTRGWMEFHPSSRHGSGTATYGYIPSSIATFVRAGAISQKTVLDRGTLGVHYALDWDGYGGLRDMINTFGEDYSPYPTEEMVQDSRFTEWELGDDLPWREVAKAEEEKLEKMAAERELLRRQEEDKVTATAEETSSEAINDEDMEDILFVANILTSLDHGANVVANILTSLDRGPANVQHPSAPVSGLEQASNDPTTNTMAPSLLAPKTYDESSDDCDFETKGCISENNPLAHLAKVAATTKECEDEKALLIQTPQDFKQWNFGLS